MSIDIKTRGILVPLFASVLLLACASQTQKGAEAGTGLLIIDVQLADMVSNGMLTGRQFGVYSFSVKNMENGDVHRITMYGGSGLIELPTGTYCLNDIAATFVYCGQPLFDVKKDKVMNAGYFVFALDNKDHLLKLTEAFKNPEEVESLLSRDQRKTVEDFVSAHAGQ